MRTPERGETVLLLEARRDFDYLEDAYRTMTVGELIDYLRMENYNTPVYISNDRGFSYGVIKESRFYDDEVEEEEEEEEEEYYDEDDEEY